MAFREARVLIRGGVGAVHDLSILRLRDPRHEPVLIVPHVRAAFPDTNGPVKVLIETWN